MLICKSIGPAHKGGVFNKNDFYKKYKEKIFCLQLSIIIVNYIDSQIDNMPIVIRLLLYN